MTVFPSSIREINQLPDPEKHAIYQTLIPKWVLESYGIDPTSLKSDGRVAVRFRCPSTSRAVEITVKRYARDADPLMYVNMSDTFNQQLLVLLVIVNDLTSQRFAIDIDQEGNPTHFGTVSRNIAAEIAAMHAGLAPGQVRRGLRVFKTLVPLMETFVSRMGHDIFFIEPLAYHNAIVFEKYGFNYLYGRDEMQQINEKFQPGNIYYDKLDESSPFRMPGAWNSIRGRSWAIHDGLLGHPYTGFQMYKRLGWHAKLNTAKDATW